MKELSIVLFLFYPTLHTTIYGGSTSDGNMAVIAIASLSFLFINTIKVLIRGVKPNFSSLGAIVVGLIFISAVYDITKHSGGLYEFQIFTLNLIGSICLVLLVSSGYKSFRLLYITYALVCFMTALSMKNFIEGDIFLYGKKDMAYQTYSYNLALMISYSLFVFSRLIMKRRHVVLIIIIVAAQIALLLVYGGRGAFVALVISFMWYLKDYIKSKKFWILVSFSLILLLVYWDRLYPLFTGLQRIATIGSLEGSSSRLGPWLDGLELIIERPFFGYGVLSANIELYVHNIALNILMQYGVFFGLFFLAFIFYKSFILFKRKMPIELEFFLPIIVITLVRLTFSSSYLQFADFIFLLLMNFANGKKG